MIRLSKDKVIENIIKAAEDYNFDACTLLTFAHIETGGTFNNLARSKNGKYVGVFQLSDGYGGVKGDDRLDPYKSAVGTIKVISNIKKDIEEKGIKWEDFYIYLSHQQGKAGLIWILEDAKDGKLIKDHYNRTTKSKRGSVLLNNSAKAWKLTENDKIQTWLDRWREYFNNVANKCSIKCNLSGGRCVVYYNGIAYKTSTNVNYLFALDNNYYLYL